MTFAPVSWVTLQSLTLVDLTFANDNIPLPLTVSAGSAQGSSQVADFSPADDGAQWVAVAVFTIGSTLNVTRTSGITTLHFYDLFRSTRF